VPWHRTVNEFLLLLDGIADGGKGRASRFRRGGGFPPRTPSFVARFGSDEQCHDYRFRQRWRQGFACRARGHQRAWKLASIAGLAAVALADRLRLLRPGGGGLRLLPGAARGPLDPIEALRRE
jgi:hypothetical protein